MTIRASRSLTTVCRALARLHSATAIIIQLNAAPPGTPRRVRAMTADQIASAVDASSAATCTVVGQNTRASLSAQSLPRRSLRRRRAPVELSCRWILLHSKLAVGMAADGGL